MKLEFTPISARAKGEGCTRTLLKRHSHVKAARTPLLIKCDMALFQCSSVLINSTGIFSCIFSPLAAYGGVEVEASRITSRGHVRRYGKLV